LTWDHDNVTGNGQSAEAPPPPASTGTPGMSLAVEKFQACRWRRPAEDGAPECCGHRDVLPLTGTHGFDPGAWCEDCILFKLRRVPRKNGSTPFIR